MKIIMKVDGKELPCKPTVGAMLRFKEETGKEVNEIDPRSFSELATYFYCCVAGACNREGTKFDLSLMDFADRISPEDMAAWQGSIPREAEPEADGEDEKKSLPESSTF